MNLDEAAQMAKEELDAQELITSNIDEKTNFLCIILSDFFFGRTDVFSLQHETGQYFPERRMLTQEDLRKHLKGEITVGGYSVGPNNDAKSLCFDLDVNKEAFKMEGLSDRLKDELKNVCQLLYDTCLSFDLRPLIEFSGRKGLHCWCPFLERIPATDVKTLGNLILEKVGFKADRGHFRLDLYPDVEVERFPKQAQIKTDGLGNLIKTPLGKHQKSGNFSYFLDENFQKIDDPYSLLSAVFA